MAEQAQDGANNLVRLWEEHIRHEFSTRSTDDTLETMVGDAYVDHVPVLTGGSGQAELRQFYEHIYWDQASVLDQLGLLNSEKLPVSGAESARKVLDPAVPANSLIRRGR